MFKRMAVVVAVVALSACASNSERLADAHVRPHDRADCLVGGDALDTERASGVRSVQNKRCAPEESVVIWSTSNRDKGKMEVDFKRKDD